MGNTNGSFTCACNHGYSGSGTQCDDVNECDTGDNQCSADAVCANNVGGYDCTCNPGYVSVSIIDGYECEDVDECTQLLDNCHGDSTCKNTPGGFKCECDHGFDGNGVDCEANFMVQNGGILGGGIGGGLAVGLIIAAGLVILLIFFFRRRRDQQVNPVATVKSIEAAIPKEAAKPERIVLRSLRSVKERKPSLRKQPEPESSSDSEPEVEVKTEPAVQAAPAPEPAPVPAPEPKKPAANQLASEESITNSAGATLKLGDRVKANGYQEGVVRYIGDLKDVALSGIKYIGVELDQPEGSGDGSINGHRYFTCNDFHALFTTVQFVEPL